MSKSNDVLSGPARKRLNLLQRVQQLCQSGGEFSMHKLIKSYSLDPNISAIMQEIGLVERSGTDKFPQVEVDSRYSSKCKSRKQDYGNSKGEKAEAANAKRQARYHTRKASAKELTCIP
jgi:hypothetical protein